MYDLGALLGQFILASDSYKQGHWSFSPPNFENSYGYIEARKGGDFKEVQFFGLQYALRYFMTQQITLDMIDEAQPFVEAHGLPFNRRMWDRIVTVHNGYLPLIIKALPEGIVVPHGTVLVTVESTDPHCVDLAAFVETLLLRAVWFPTTIATRSMRWWRLIQRSLVQSGDETTTDFKMVDFGARGVSSTETAGLAGMAHLVNFQVTDNLMGIRFAKEAYDATMPGVSIPATEHSVTTAWGKDNELAFFRNILKVHGHKANPLGGRCLISAVIDTYHQDEAIKMWGTTLMDDLVASNMTLVVRPDSGDPIINVVHVLDLLGTYFGFTVNDKGYRVLPDYVRVIQGDGINEESLRRILQRVTYNGWSIDNLTFGSGGGLLVHEVERDTHRFAMKTSEVTLAGKVQGVQKLVATDPSKASKIGRFAVVIRAGQVVTVAEDALLDGEENLLRTVYLDGKLLNETSFDAVRTLSSEYRILPSPDERHEAIAHDLLD